MANRLRRLFSFGIIGILSASTILGWHVFSAQGVTYTWDNEAGDGLWSSCTNWTSNTCPGASDIAQFDPAVSDTSSTIDAGFAGSVAGIDMKASFTGTVTQARTLTVGSSGFVLTAGTFTGASQTIDINGPLTLTAGTFTSTSGALTLSGGLTIGAGNTFNHNSGTFTFDGASDRTVDVDTSETFNAVTISMTSNTDDLVITSGDTLVATGTLTMTNGTISTGTLEAQGATITKATTWDGGSGLLLITQNTVRNITWTNGPISALTLNASGTTITINASSVFTYQGTLTVTAGTITHAGSTNNTSFQGNFLVNGGTFVAAPGLSAFATALTRTWGVTSGTFTHGSGTVWINAVAGNFTLSGSTTFYNVVFSSTENAYSIYLPAGQTQTIANYGWFLASNAAAPETVRIPIESTSAGSQANINIQNKAAFASVSLKDINNTGVSTPCAAQCNDRGNNAGIDFSGSLGVTVADPVGPTTEAGATTTFSVVLDSRPTADVSVPITSTDTTEGTVSAATLTFTTANWSTPQNVTVTGVDDVTNDGAISYTVTVGSTTSSDANYSGINPSDVTITNADDDATTAAIEFENTSDFTFEDVKDSTGTNITHYEHFYGGQGTLMTADGGAVVDITNSRIREGCIVRISGVDYNLIRVTDEPTYGYNVSMSRADLTLNDLEAELIAADGVVNSIRCIELTSGTAKLNDAFVRADSVAAGGGWMDYDTANDKVWASNWGGGNTLYGITVSTATSNSYTTGGGPDGVTYDSENDRVWVANSTSDTITAFTASTGAYAFGGTLGASSFAVGDAPLLVEHDSVNDAIWVSHNGSGNNVIKVDADDGSILGTYAAGGDTYGIAIDTVRNRVWFLSYCLTGGQCVVILDAATGAYVNGTLANSTYPVPYTNADTMLEYDATNDVVWVLDEVPSTTKGYVYRIDAATVAPETSAFTGGGGLDMVYKAATDELWIANDNVGSWSAIDASRGREIREYQTNDCPFGITVDGAGDIWGSDCANDTTDRHVPNGVPLSRYYTITTTDSSQIDTSSATEITAATVTQTLNSQTIHYAVSFDDRRTFSVLASGAQRHIASNKNTVHGGTEGNWYYRNDASVWAAAPSNDAEEAISLAILNGSTNNRMTGVSLAALTSGNWTTLGFSSSIDTLDLSTTLFTSSVRATPSVQSVAFTLAATSDSGSDGNDPDPIYTGSETIAANACSASQNINLTLGGLRVSDFMVSEDPTFVGVDWSAFEADDADGISMTVPFTLSAGDGNKTIYAIYRSSTQDQSGIKNTVIELDTANGCSSPAVDAPSNSDEENEDDADSGDVETPSNDDAGISTPSEASYLGCEGLLMSPISVAEQERYRLGVNPLALETYPTELIYPGDFIRSESFETVYCITENRDRRAFMDETTFFTQTRTFAPVKWVADETLTEFPLSYPMLPRQDVSFLKFESDPSIYYFIQDPQDPTHGILRWVTTEELARYIAGDSWSDYVIDLNPTLIDRFDFAAPFITIDDVLAADITLTDFRSRELLNENSAEAVDTGITSIFEQTKDALRAAGWFLKDTLNNLKSLF